MRIISALAALVLTACAAEAPDDAIVPVTGGGKSDAIDQVSDLGALELDVAREGVFAEDLEFHGYRIAVRDGARVRIEITQKGTSRKLDTTLFLYGPVRDGEFGTEAIAFDDDSGWGKQSRMTNLELEGGEYLVVVGTHDARGRGSYRLLASCEEGECAPQPEPACDELVANNILQCVAFQVADSGGELTRADALQICSDGEALGPVFDGLCAAPQPPSFCAGGFDAFAQTMGPACAEELAPFAVECVFGDQFRDLQTSADVITGVRRVLTSASPLSDVERQQIVIALQSSGHDDVTTAEAAFARADDNEINQIELWDRTSARPYVAYELGAGDTSIGAYFVLGSTERVAVISDGSLERCSAAAGPQGGACSSDGDCSVGVCMGRSEASDGGRCTVLAGFGEQTTCSPAEPCSIAEGLICAGLTRTDDGLCLPAWMRGNFGETFGDEALAIPDGNDEGLSRTVLVNGLATVDMDVELDLFVEHADASQLEVTLTNPQGTEVVVPMDGSTRFSGALLGFSGDEVVNGAWTLRIVDGVAGEAGVLSHWTLHLGSRFD
jgi:hypothetical protein